MEVRTDRHQPVALAPAELWGVLGRVDRYRSWWPWLRRLDATSLAAGEVWRCTIQPPLPYVVRFELELVEVEPPSHVAATLTGDICGTARIDVTPTAGGADLHLRSTLSPSTALLRAVGALAAPLARFGHDRVVDHGLRRLAAVVADEAAAQPGRP